MRNKIVQIARNEVGYKEQGANITKYGEWYGMQDEWCNMFVCWCAAQAGIGEDIIPKMAYVPSTANWFDAKGQYKNSRANGGNYTPQPGDIVLFDYNHNTTSDHIGIVEKTEGNTLYTIEGNKNNMVKRCIYSLDSGDIRAYCVPAYVENVEEAEPQYPYDRTQVIKNLQTALNNSYDCGLAVDGIVGPATNEHLRRHPVGVGNSNELVRWVQDRLVNHKGYSVGNYGIDGIFGSDTQRAVRDFQRDNNLTVDGIAGINTNSILI